MSYRPLFDEHRVYLEKENCFNKRKNLPRCQALYLSEYCDCITRYWDDGGLFHDILVERVDGFNIWRFWSGNVHTHLHQTDWSIVVLVELNGHLIFAGSTLRHTVQRNFEAGFLVAIEAQYRTAKMNGAPIPTPQRQLFFQAVQVVRGLEEFRDLFFVARLETGVSMQITIFHEQSDAEISPENTSVNLG